jgi:SsrA-binding protein
VKSIKLSQVNIKDAIVVLQDNELWVVGMDIPLYKKTSVHLVPGYQSKQRRKLLATKQELAKISAALNTSGNVFVPIEVFINKT